MIDDHYAKIKSEWDACCAFQLNETQLKANIFFKFVTDKSCMLNPYDEILSAGGSVMNRESFVEEQRMQSFASSLHSVNEFADRESL